METLFEKAFVKALRKHSGIKLSPTFPDFTPGLC